MVAELLQAERPAMCFVTNIGDAVLTLPTLRALGEMFTAPITVICPKTAFDLCFRQVSPRLVDITGLPLVGHPPLPGHPERPLDYQALAAEIGAVDVFIDTLPWGSLSSVVIDPLLQHLAPTTSIGFGHHDVVVPRGECHAADTTFRLAQLFDPSLRIEDFAQPLSIPAHVQQQARSIRAALPTGAKVLAVHADTNWEEKRWPVTRFIDLLDRFLSRHPNFVTWVVGMGYEELTVGRERDRVIPYLGLPLDLTMALVATADLFVGVDSSMLHAADLARVPGVGLFGPTRSQTWGFRFAPHRHLDRTTMAEIAVEEVLEALESVVAEQDDQDAVLRNWTGTDLLAAVRQFYDSAMLWHSERPAATGNPAGLADKARYLHSLNFALWHHEDAVRRPDADDAEVVRRKRCIDDINARRNAAIEDIDVDLLERAEPNPGAPLHTETPGTIVDRLSVLTLRIVHTTQPDQSGGRLGVLHEQYDDLFAGLEELLARMQAGEVTFKVYRQFKSAAQRSYCELFQDRELHQ
ncbi:hypothetical protein A5647_11375 [Mycobacterium sp. 1100029.7]|nr:hypothetical protein A5647_11375 [Mycobacterium sp. 1100029.7]